MNCIYRIYSKQPHITECYIGKTRMLHKRKSEHKHHSKKENSLVAKYISHHGFENFVFEPLVELEEYNTQLLTALEAKFFQKYKPSLNYNHPSRSTKEYQSDNKERVSAMNTVYRLKNRDKYQENARQQYEKNKERLKKRCSEYYHKNKEKIKERNKAEHTCICGCKFLRQNKKEHLNSLEHRIGMSSFRLDLIHANL